MDVNFKFMSTKSLRGCLEKLRLSENLKFTCSGREFSPLNCKFRGTYSI